MRVVMMGPPGAGKGTQAALLASRLSVPAISTGDIFRSQVAQGTALGVQARAYMDSGEYVPDEVTNAMVRDRLFAPDVADGFILDGYPRTVAQVEVLDDVLRTSEHAVDVVVCLVVDTGELVERLARRAVSEGRADDTADVIRQRQLVYARQTAPLVSLYADRGCLREVDGAGSVEQVTARLQEAVGERASSDLGATRP